MATTYLSTSVVRKVVVAFGVGVLSHVAMDAIPHSDYRMLPRPMVVWVSACEVVATVAIAALLLRGRFPPRWRGSTVAGFAGACLPDIKFAARVLLPQETVRPVERYGDAFHGFFHAEDLANPMIGLGIEVAFAIALLLLLSAFPRTSRPAPNEDGCRVRSRLP